MYRLLLLLLLPLQLFAFELKQDILKAKTGDFIVYSYKESLVLLRIRESSPHMVTLEEVSSPRSGKGDMSWQEWMTKDAPGHTSWTITKIAIATGKVISIFSVVSREFLTTNPAFLFLPTLLQLPLKPIEAHDRKYVGPEPMAGEVDHRRLWKPRIIFEGKELSPQIAAYRIQWPDDASDLSGKPIDLYFAQDGAITYLPYWIEVAAGLGKAKISALDSGTGLTSPVKLSSYEQSEKSVQ